MAMRPITLKGWTSLPYLHNWYASSTIYEYTHSFFGEDYFVSDSISMWMKNVYSLVQLGKMLLWLKKKTCNIQLRAINTIGVLHKFSKMNCPQTQKVQDAAIVLEVYQLWRQGVKTDAPLVHFGVQFGSCATCAYWPIMFLYLWNILFQLLFSRRKNNNNNNTIMM